MITLYDLLATCPEDEIVRLQTAHKTALRQNWRGAAKLLRAAAAEDNTEWHQNCAEVAARYELKQKGN